ncbi:hypothetical protein NDU88_003849 [Pleurodeles waltl]|uniref:Uncharacterized protein n=1 Tax=Pleurodeles waltl TaxID=8319 RepID=A0AAV7WQK4_PLEWA|nr:hypothetical protein NDU88_003849 [Pleurodeles waltl]
MLKEFRIPSKPSTTVDIEEEESALEAPATPEPHGKEIKEGFYDPEEEEVMGIFEEDWNDLETETPEDEIDN